LLSRIFVLLYVLLLSTIIKIEIFTKYIKV